MPIKTYTWSMTFGTPPFVRNAGKQPQNIVRPMFKLIQKSNHKRYHETQKDSFLVGKAKNCEIVIADPQISDVQAKIGTKDNRYFIKNMGPGPISINGHPTGGQFLNDGDELALGKSKFVIQIDNKDFSPSRQTPMEACLSGTTESTFAAWETEFQVKFARIDNSRPATRQRWSFRNRTRGSASTLSSRQTRGPSHSCLDGRDGLAERW